MSNEIDWVDALRQAGDQADELFDAAVLSRFEARDREGLLAVLQVERARKQRARRESEGFFALVSALRDYELKRLSARLEKQVSNIVLSVLGPQS